MRIFKKLAFLLSIAITSAVVQALPRDSTEKAAFRKENPCPSTGEKKGACPGYEVDHKKALMNRGKDKPENMQWLNKEEHKEKTKSDIEQCKGSYLCKDKRYKKELPWEDRKKEREKAKEKK